MFDENARVTVEVLLKHGASTADCVDTLISLSQLDGLIEHAKSGDASAAKEILGLASAYLNPHTEMFGPMPSSLRKISLECIRENIAWRIGGRGSQLEES